MLSRHGFYCCENDPLPTALTLADSLSDISRILQVTGVHSPHSLLMASIMTFLIKLRPQHGNLVSEAFAYGLH
jgi:hypothetical protein